MKLQTSSFGSKNIRVSVRVQMFENYASHNGFDGSYRWKAKGGHSLNFIVNGDWWLQEGGADYSKPKIQALIGGWSNDFFKYEMIEVEDDLPYQVGYWFTYETEAPMDITEFIAPIVEACPYPFDTIMAQIAELKGKEVLSKAEKDLVASYYPDFAEEYLQLQPFVEPARYLNLFVYNEIEHHEREFRMETGQ